MREATARAVEHLLSAFIFDFANEVMLGKQFWEFVGGEGAFEELLGLYARVGGMYAPEIARLRA